MQLGSKPEGLLVKICYSTMATQSSRTSRILPRHDESFTLHTHSLKLKVTESDKAARRHHAGCHVTIRQSLLNQTPRVQICRMIIHSHDMKTAVYVILPSHYLLNCIQHTVPLFWRFDPAHCPLILAF